MSWGLCAIPGLTASLLEPTLLAQTPHAVRSFDLRHIIRNIFLVISSCPCRFPSPLVDVDDHSRDTCLLVANSHPFALPSLHLLSSRSDITAGQFDASVGFRESIGPRSLVRSSRELMPATYYLSLRPVHRIHALLAFVATLSIHLFLCCPFLMNHGRELIPLFVLFAYTVLEPSLPILNIAHKSKLISRRNPVALSLLIFLAPLIAL